MTKWFATLKDGRRVELKKYCECQTHEGPCWLDADESWHRANRKMLDNRKSMLSIYGFRQEEYVRLRIKIAEMVGRSIEKIEVVDDGTG